MPERVEANFNFRVEIDGLEETLFSEVSGLGSTIEVLEYRDGGDAMSASRLLPGRARYERIVLRRGLAPNFDLWDWHQQALAGRIERRSGMIVALTAEQEPTVSWRFRNGWVAAYRGPHFTATGNGVAIESVELVHEGLLREAT